MSSTQLHHDALDRLGQDIVRGRYPVGAVVTLAELEKRFVVSRTVAREIMRVLEALGVVRSRRRVGITIQPRSSWNLLDPRVVGWRLEGPERSQAIIEVTELRVALQPLAASLAARHASKAQRDKLVELGDRIAAAKEADNLAEAVSAEVDFVCLLFRAGRNELFASVDPVFRLVQSHAPSGQNLVVTDPRWVMRYRGIALAVASGDEDLARRWSAEQVRAVLGSVSRVADAARPALDERPGVEGWSV